MASVISLKFFGDLFGYRPEQEISDEKDFKALTQEQLDALDKVNREASEIDGKQGKSIHLYMSEMIISARNRLDAFFKKRAADNKIKGMIDKIEENKEALPKKGFVKQAEETKVHVDTERALEEAARERGGHYREERTRK